ncbi:MAG: hypothetical protein J7L92_04635 [Dehalococcoidia bacterium]|nr:hypothetical protein [Dehalococcoidia bacterium]
MVFPTYIIGITVAIVMALMLRKTIIRSTSSYFVMGLPLI